MSSKYFNSSDDTDKNNIYSSDKSHLHREAVRETIETSISEVINRPSSYHNTEKQEVQRSSIPSNKDGSERPASYSHTSTGTNAMYNNSERNSHKNDVEQATKARYGTAGIVKDTDNSGFKGSIKGTSTAELRDRLKFTQSEGYSQKTWGKSEVQEKKGLTGTAASVVSREIDAAMGGGGNGEIDDRAKGQAQKFGYKTGKFAILGGFSVGRGTLRMGRYGKKLSNDVTAGLLSSSEAKKLFSGRLKANMLGGGKSAASILKLGTLHIIEDFKGSDDLGMKAITKPKDIVVGTRRTFKTMKATGKTIKKTFATTKNIVLKVQQSGRAIMASGQKLFSNPLVLKGVGITVLSVLIAAIVISVISTVVGMIPTISLKSEDYELSETYLYITELDARMEDDIVSEDTKLHIPKIDTYNYYINGVKVKKEQIQVYTNADSVLAFFDSKYEDYSFSGIISGIFGTTVKEELEAIHTILHQTEKTRWIQEIEHTETITDPISGIEIPYTWYENVYHMDISLTTKSWANYYAENKNSLLTIDQQQQYEAIQDVGVYTFRQQLSSPFVGVDWSVGVSSRWGWRIHPITGVLGTHKGLDIAMPGGTPINACNGGVVTTGDNPDGWGNYVKVTMTNGDYTLYAHMSRLAVSDGQNVKPGDIVGYVGTTGTSTGNHLHLEYYQKGKSLNPLIFTECEKQIT